MQPLLPVFTLLSATCLLSVVNAAAISQTEFTTAVTRAGYRAPSAQTYQSFAEGTKSYSREEAAMFLAQLLHESAGFIYTEELACLKGNKCAGKYVDKVGLPGKTYHGRGYIQLTWGSNYKAASQALGMGDRLLQNPEVVATDKRIAMLVSTWFWNARVKPRLAGANANKFGVTTKAINGGECTKFPQRAKNRWNIYVKVASALNIANKAKENGCYN